MTDQTELHNKLAGEVVSSIIQPVLGSGGKITDVFVLLESIVLGVLLVNEKTSDIPSEAALDELTRRVKVRLAEQRGDSPALATARH